MVTLSSAEAFHEGSVQSLLQCLAAMPGSQLFPVSCDSTACSHTEQPSTLPLAALAQDLGSAERHRDSLLLLEVAAIMQLGVQGQRCQRCCTATCLQVRPRLLAAVAAVHTC